MSKNKDLYSVITLEKAKALIAAHAMLMPKETTGVVNALGRISASAVISPEDLPAWRRSSMDGYAVKAMDTHGATEGLPAYLDATDTVDMGRKPSFMLRDRHAASISTGGMLPDGADAVVMVEYTEPTGSGIEVTKPVAPGENVVQPGEDFAKGDTLLASGVELTPARLGAMQAVGIAEVQVYLKPRVLIISSGDELVELGEKPAPGQIRDINSTTLSTSVVSDGAALAGLARVGDDYEDLNKALYTALDVADVILITGGSSVSMHDYTADAIAALGSPGLLAHGVAISPGKPTIIGSAEGKMIFGLSGHPGAALVVYHILVRPLLWMMQGGTEKSWSLRIKKVKAKLDRNVVSKSGRTDFIRVSIREENETILATPIFGSSGLIMTLTSSDGIIEIPEYNEGLKQGQEVEVELW